MYKIYLSIRHSYSSASKKNIFLVSEPESTGSSLHKEMYNFSEKVTHSLSMLRSRSLNKTSYRWGYDDTDLCCISLNSVPFFFLPAIPFPYNNSDMNRGKEQQQVVMDMELLRNTLHK